ncbi:MAG: phosphoribosylanthranilate isomerase [Actinobacteria bacterium]|nr:phosphoribosylanthranilate isomerase [Actinomycetota bacterium]
MPKIKICGICREQDIDFINEAKPDYAGFIFAEESRRKISGAQAREYRTMLDTSVRTVGVFVNASQTMITSLLRDGVIDAVQLHGNEDEDYIRALKAVTDAPVIKAVRFEDFEQIKGLECSAADYLLLDNGSGGTGMAFDWSQICKLKKPFFLAGGVNLSNIDEAMRIDSYCIDVSSGVETDGCKDRKKIITLVNRVRGA